MLSKSLLIFFTLSTVTARVAIPLRHVAIPQKNVLVTTSNDTESLTDGQDFFFVGDITIGTPPQTFSVQIDTGSAMLWIPSTTCMNQYCLLHNRFDSSKSTTFVTSTKPFNETYGDGSNAYGYLGTDTVTIAGITIQNQQFGSAIYENEGFAAPAIDGLLGLGEFNPNGTADENSAYIEPLQNMFNQKLISERVFSIALHTQGASSGGELLFGAINSLEYSGNISYIPIAKDITGAPFFWAILLDSITISGRSISNDSISGRSVSNVLGNAAIVDTGTSYLIIPQDSATEFYSLINAYVDLTVGLPWLNCSTIANMTITFGANGHKFPLPSAYWIVQTNANDQYVLAAQSGPGIPSYLKPGNSKYCYAKASAALIKEWVISVPFLQYYYAVFDLDNAQVGFALQSGGGVPNQTNTQNMTSTSGIITQTAMNVTGVPSEIVTASGSNRGISTQIGMSSILIVAVVMLWYI